MKTIVITLLLLMMGMNVMAQVVGLPPEIVPPPPPPPPIVRYKLFVNTTPKNTTVKITNIGPKYYGGIRLANGTYKLQVSRRGYRTVSKTVRIRGRNKNVSIKLSKIVAQSTTPVSIKKTPRQRIQKIAGRYIKLNHRGKPLPRNARSWQCVKDTRTGLIWEVKTRDGGLHDWNKDYNWQEAKTVYRRKVNTKGWCGSRKWRLPTRFELRELVYCGNGISNKIAWDKTCNGKGFFKDGVSYTRPTINTQVFPNTKSSGYWSGSPVAANSTFAWSVDFSNGHDGWGGRPSAEFVRFVRGGQ